MKERRKNMQIKLYEEKKKDGQTGRILIILDEPGADLAEFVKKYVGSLGGAQKAIETVAPGISEPVPEEPERKPDVQADTSVKPAAPAKTQATKEEELFPDAPVPEPKAKAPAKPAEAPKKEAPAPAAEPDPFEEVKELWEMLDGDSQEEFLANYGAGCLEDIEPDSLPVLLEDIKGKVFG
jgi:hypothetical protein